MTYAGMMLSNNGFDFSEPDENGDETTTLNMSDPGTGKTVTITITIPAHGPSTLVITHGTEETERRTGSFDELAVHATDLARAL